MEETGRGRPDGTQDFSHLNSINLFAALRVSKPIRAPSHQPLQSHDEHTAGSSLRSSLFLSLYFVALFQCSSLARPSTMTMTATMGCCVFSLALQLDARARLCHPACTHQVSISNTNRTSTHSPRRDLTSVRSISPRLPFARSPATPSPAASSTNIASTASHSLHL